MKIPEVELSAKCRDKFLDRRNWLSNQNLHKTKVKGAAVPLKLWGLESMKSDTWFSLGNCWLHKSCGVNRNWCWWFPSQKKELTDISSCISWEKWYFMGQRSQANEPPLCNFPDTSLEIITQSTESKTKTRKIKILEHKSGENLHTEIFHDNVTFNQLSVRKLGADRVENTSNWQKCETMTVGFLFLKLISVQT